MCRSLPIRFDLLIESSAAQRHTECAYYFSAKLTPMPLPSKIIVLGIGDDGLDGLTAASRQHIESAQLLIGPPSVLRALAAQAEDDFIPVVAPVGVGQDGKSFNINADTAAGAVAAALKAKRVLFLTDVTGVLDKSGNLIKQLSVAEAKGLIDSGAATGGMIPKLETAMQAVEKGVEAAVILDGRKPHALLMELFTEHGAGTLVRQS